MQTDVLHLKYRPGKLSEVIGHKAQVSSLASVIERGASKVFLFTGQSGTGKTTLARIAAMMIGCALKDIQEVDAATYSGIEDVRKLTVSLQYKPMGGKVKALILDECHALSKAAWQALLKLLEEPPEYVYLFLCTTEAERVPASIRTRCSVYDLKPVPTPEIFEWLCGVADEERILPDAEGEKIIDLCAKEAHGSPRQAIVNLASCAAAKTRAEAATLLRSAADAPEAKDLAVALVKGASWPEVSRILATLKETNPESVRHVVRGYTTATILGAASEKAAIKAAKILSHFSMPFNPGDGLSPVVLATVKALYS